MIPELDASNFKGDFEAVKRTLLEKEDALTKGTGSFQVGVIVFTHTHGRQTRVAREDSHSVRCERLPSSCSYFRQGGTQRRIFFRVFPGVPELLSRLWLLSVLLTPR